MAGDIATFVRAGDSIERATSRLAGYGVPPAVVEAARRLYEQQVGRIRELRDPRTLLDEPWRSGGWYAGTQPGDVFWPALRDRLTLSGLDGDAVTSIGRASDKIVSLLCRPGDDQIRTRGLVLGYVQSGKTTSFMSVIAKAADAGYRMFIVLSGITDSLRSQTQSRLDEVLVGDQRERWHWLTEPDRDFAATPLNAANLLRDDASRIIAVVKKNPYRLRRLKQFLDGAGDTILKRCPILLIDDEADQATIDVGARGRLSRINSLIRQILAKPKAAYVAYTATPFANLLINPADYEGLYPRDFIVDLGRPDNYFGTEKIFGRDLLDADEGDADDGLDVVRLVSDDEVSLVRPAGSKAQHTWSAEVPESLATALRWFVLATAARRARDGYEQHSTMLVHTSMLTGAHYKLAAKIEDYLQELHEDIASDDEATLELLRRQWLDESGRVPVQGEVTAALAWSDVHARLAGAAEAARRVIIDNYQSAARLVYRRDFPTTAVVVGGNTLSRGLTLEGLVCSYFVRSANAYDTLLQMGRWFGYRPGYEDLVRIWMTAELESWFFDLATVEAEIRAQIRRYEEEGLTPGELPVKIRTHPSMIITSAAKMRHAVDAEVSYGSTKQQTILFNHKDDAWLQHNLAATGRFLQRAPLVQDGNGPGTRTVLRDVPADLILEFLNDYQFHPSAQSMRRDLLAGYIALQNDNNALLTWNVVVMSDPQGGNGTIPIGPYHANLIQRSRLRMPGIPHANIKVLVSRFDWVADLDMPRQEILSMTRGEETDGALSQVREDLLGPVGLLCIYPISKDSLPRNPARRKDGQRQLERVPLEAADHVIGVGLFFPENKANRALRYKSVDLSSLAIETDEPDLDQIDAEDEEADRAQDAAVSGGMARRRRR